MELKHTKVLVVGFGRSGEAAARFCANRGADVTVFDAAPASKFEKTVSRLRNMQIRYCFGDERLDLFTGADIVVASPGVPLTTAGLKAAREAEVPIVSEMELALQEGPLPVIAITGTNGKSTTTTLIGEILKAENIPAAVGGNLGTPMCDLLDVAKNARWWVIEVSSYQLEITPSLHPAIAVLLNITPDHLDRYANFEAYVAAKAKILASLVPADTVVFNAEDRIVAELVADCAAIKVPFDARSLWCGGHIRAAVPGHMMQEWDLASAKLVGRHNQENMLAAGLAAAAAGATAPNIERVLREFPGLPHRCQFVREWNGVKFFNDSKGTNVGAVVRSIESFREPMVLIAGGLDKNTGYRELQPAVKERVKCAILIGQAREQMKNELAPFTETRLASSMDEAVRVAAQKASSGDIVLLSPACASFDMYENYAARGDDFVKCVMRLQ